MVRRTVLHEILEGLEEYDLQVVGESHSAREEVVHDTALLLHHGLRVGPHIGNLVSLHDR